jgi:glycosyltransferase involved in cell wall biosynthesis
LDAQDQVQETIVKLIIQIPCLNEAEHIEVTLAALPRQIPGVSQIEYLVIDDGSTDGTAEIAQRVGVHYISRHPVNRGLATAFQTGVQRALSEGADVIVNTDADNQYNAADIEKLIRPILERQADLVIGIRPIDDIEHFSWLKKRLQKLGSVAVRALSGTDIRDVTSGFRALSRDAAISINLTTQFTHTLETLIQAGNKNLRIAQVPIRVNDKRRESRLFQSMGGYVARSMLDVLQIYLHYQGGKVLARLGLVLFAPGLFLGLRYVYLEMTNQGGGRVQSLILAAILIIMGYQSWLMSLFLTTQRSSRILIEKLISQTKGP